MNADGSDQRKLTSRQGRNDYPIWSPDGHLILFQSLRDGNMDIYVMNADGTNQHKITNHPADDHDATWMPW